MNSSRFRARALSAISVVVLLTFLGAADAEGQGDAIRRARDAVREKTLSLDALFGKEPPITTSITDAKDGVPSLDGYEPEWYAPMAEMPWGQDGTILLFPGTYSLMSQGYCLKPGTFGPQSGDGYLYTEWKGPKADLVKHILQRHLANSDIPQVQVQLILWAIIIRTDITQLQPDTRAAATRLLTPSEIADLVRAKLGIVPDAMKQRVLQSAPAPVRMVLEAENEMRRLLTSADTKYADMEKVAVLSGTVPASGTEFVIPRGRWSYYPAGFFVRYFPFGYQNVRIDVYYPETFEVHRDASGRITSVTIPNGRGLEFDQTEHPIVQFISRESNGSASRFRLLEAAAHNENANAKAALLALAHADYTDLVELQQTLRARHFVARGGVTNPSAFIREASHAALARVLGLERQLFVARGSELERRLRPVRTAHGYRYVVAPVPSDESAIVQAKGGGGGLQPSGGGGTAPGMRQRQGASGLPSSAPSGARGAPTPPLNTYGSPSPGTKSSSAASTAAQAARGVGTASNPGAMLGAGLSAANSAANTVSSQMGGGPPDDANDPETLADGGRGRVGVRHPTGGVIQFASYSARFTAGASRRSMRAQQGTADYQSFSQPRTIAFPAVVADGRITPEQAKAWNDVLSATFRMGMALEAAGKARGRLAAAVKARDSEWQFKQGRAVVYLKRAAGIAMVEVARNLEALQSVAGRGLGVTAEEIESGRQRLVSSGFSPEISALQRDLGLTDTQQEAYRRELVAQNAPAAALRLPDDLYWLEKSLYEYGAYLSSLPNVSAPWN